MLTLGPAEAEEQLRDCMAIGADRGILLETEGEEWDAQATAAAIVDAVRGGTGAVRPPPVRQRVGGRRGLPGRHPRRARARAAGRHGPEEDRARATAARACERDVGGARDVYEAPLPAVLTVLEGLNLPRYPSVPGRLRAKQKPLARTAVLAARAAAREAAARRAGGTGQAGGDPRRRRGRSAARRRGAAGAGSRVNVLCFVEPERRSLRAGSRLRALARRTFGPSRSTAPTSPPPGRQRSRARARRRDRRGRLRPRQRAARARRRASSTSRSPPT